MQNGDRTLINNPDPNPTAAPPSEVPPPPPKEESTITPPKKRRVRAAWVIGSCGIVAAIAAALIHVAFPSILPGLLNLSESGVLTGTWRGTADSVESDEVRVGDASLTQRGVLHLSLIMKLTHNDDDEVWGTVDAESRGQDGRHYSEKVKDGVFRERYLILPFETTRGESVDFGVAMLQLDRPGRQLRGFAIGTGLLHETIDLMSVQLNREE